MDGSAASALGSAIRQGYGRVAWRREKESVRHFDSSAILRWLDDTRDLDWRKLPPVSGTHKVAFEKAVNAVSWREGSDRLALDVSLAFDGFFLVSERVDEDPDGKGKLANRRPIGTWPAGDIRPRLPGTGFKGPLRAQAERIWRTLTLDMSNESPEVQTLFGCETAAGLLRCPDFVGPPAKVVRHEMVAIDRFTGGGAEGQKFSHDVFEAPTLIGTIVVDKVFADAPDEERRRRNAALGLFVLVLRDLAEGDIAFGFGTRKGYGRVASVRVGNSDIMAAFVAAAGGEDRLRRWVDAFRSATRAHAEKVRSKSLLEA